MNIEAVVQDIFETMPSRFKSGEADENFKAELGFMIGEKKWTLSINGKSCRIVNALHERCNAVIRTGLEELIGIMTNTVDPAALFLSKKLEVDGDIEILLVAFSLFEIYKSDDVVIKDPSWVVDTLGDYFTVRENGRFMIEDLDCVELAERFGTPLFVTSEGQLRENIRNMKAAFASAYPENDVNVMWAIKSNTTFALRKIMNEEGAGGDCFSPGEIYATFITGADPERFLLTGSDRSDEAFRMAIEIGMRITLDHMDDLFILERLAREFKKKIRVLIRVKCDLPSLKQLESTFEPGISVPFEVRNLKFGVTYEEAVEMATSAKRFPHIIIEGIHSHIGRDVHLPEHWHGYAFDMITLCSRFYADTGILPKILDLGGGFAEKRDPSSHDLMNLAATIEEYADQAGRGVREGCRKHDFPYPKLWIEPGRNLIGTTTVMISRVGNVKRTPGVCTWVHVDASCNFLPSVNRHNGMSYHLLSGTRARAKAEETVDIVGPNCSGDLIQPRRKMPKMERGELLVFLDVGAYNSVASNQFNSIPRPPCLLVSGSQVDIICERETINDIFARQRIPARMLI
ncbi:MAG: SCP2 sterol-binding domain-containing protein [Desulfobacterales bacterium]